MPGLGEEKGRPAKRLFEQPDDARSCFSDFVQVAGTGEGVIMQFYESIPGIPGEKGLEEVRTRLRFTVMLTRNHAAKIAKILGEAGNKRVIEGSAGPEDAS